MCWHLATPAALICGVACGISVASADDLGDAMALFVKEYPPAAQKLDDAYSHIRAIGKKTALDENDNVSYVEIFDDARKAGAVRALSTIVEAGKADIDRAPLGLRDVEGGTADLYFSANKYPGDAKYKFYWYGPHPDFLSTERNITPELFAATCMGDMPAVAVLTGNEITTKSASFDTFEGKRVLTINYAAQGKGLEKNKWHSEGTIRLIQPGWAVLTWRSIIWDATSRIAPGDQGLTFEKRAEYSQVEPVPKVLKVESWRSKSGKKLDHAITEIKELDFGDLSDAEFHLQNYGIAAPDHLVTPGENGPTSEPVKGESKG